MHICLLLYKYVVGDRFTVQWNNVHNNDHFEDGPFTFQVSLFKDGVIHFVYREVGETLAV